MKDRHESAKFYSLLFVAAYVVSQDKDC